MLESISSEIDELRTVYNEIVDGSSFFSDKDCYLRHINEIDFGKLAENKRFSFFKFKKEGLPTEAERLEQLIRSEEWSNEKEEEIVQCRYIITDNEKNLSKIIPQQQAPILFIIKETKKKLNLLLLERRSLLGATAEEYAEKQNSQFLIYLTIYKDKELTQRRFVSVNDLDDMEDEELEPYFNFISHSRERISERQIQKISVMPFFLNHFSYCKDNVYHFLEKPLISLSNNQLTLISFGVRNLNILSNSEGQPPELIGDVKIDDIINWYDKNYSIILGKQNTKK